MASIVESTRRLVRWIRTAPDRSSLIYPRLMTLGALRGNKKTALVKVSPQNLRYFSRTPIARRAVNSIKNPIKHMEWEICPKKGVSMNSEIRKQIKIATDCFTLPNPDDSFETFVEKLVEDYLCISALTYEQQVKDENSDHPLWMWPVDSQSIEVFPLWDGSPAGTRYKQTLGTGNVSVEGVATMTDEEIAYVVPNPTTSSPYSYGPLEITARSISRLLGASEYAGNVASNAQPPHLLWMGDVDSGAVQTFRQYWKDEIEGQGNTPIVGGPDEPKAVRLTAQKDEELYLKWQRFLICEIATGFDLSIQNFNANDTPTSSGAEEGAAERDWETAVKPMAQTIAGAFNHQTIAKRLGYYQIEFKWLGLDREDQKVQAEIYEMEYINNMTTPNQQREKLGLPKDANPYSDMLYADVQIAIGEARRGGVSENEPGTLHNIRPAKVRKLK